MKFYKYSLFVNNRHIADCNDYPTAKTACTVATYMFGNCEIRINDENNENV